MGEIADMMINGEICQYCGEFLDDGGNGYPMSCGGCASDNNERVNPIAKHGQNKPKKTIVCGFNGCARKFASEYARCEHTKAVHGT